MESKPASFIKLFLKKLFDRKSQLFLFIIWGTLFFLSRIIDYLKVEILLSYGFLNFLKYFEYFLLLVGIVLTIWYFYKNRRLLLERDRIIARYVWFSVLVINNIILMVVKVHYQEIDFTIMHLIQMSLIGLALVIVGTVMNENYIRIGGVAYWLALFIAMDLPLHEQFLFEAIALAIGVILPIKLIVLRVIRKN